MTELKTESNEEFRVFRKLYAKALGVVVRAKGMAEISSGASKKIKC